MSKRKPKSSPRSPKAKPVATTATAVTTPTTTSNDNPKRQPAANSAMSALDAAARVLKDSGKPMNAKAIVDKMLAAKLWSTGGKTPGATLSSALIREIKTKGKESRFAKVGRGQFALT